MNETTKSKIKAKNTLYKKYIQKRRLESDLVLLENLIIELNGLISSTKALLYENVAKKLNNPLLQEKTYWSILKIFYSDKKIPLIPSLLVDNTFATDMRTKANIFNEYFAEQCTPLKNNSVFIDQIFLTQSRLVSLDFNEDEILKIIRKLLVMMIFRLE